MGLQGPAAAHDMPDEMVFQAHVAPEEAELHVPLRVPMAWLVDYPFPKRGPGYLDLADTEGLEAAAGRAADALTSDIAFFEDGSRLDPAVTGWRVSLPSERSFNDYQAAVASIAGQPLPDDTNLFWNQGFLDVHLVYPIEDDTSTFSLQVESPALAERLHILTTFVAPDGTERAYDLLGTMGRVELNPGLGYLLRMFAEEGMLGVLTGWEHVLVVVLLGLALARGPSIPVRSVVTFGVVVSLTVLAAGLAAGQESTFTRVVGEAAAAASLVVLAIGNVLARDLRLRWLTAGVCAVPHGILLAGGLDVLMQFREAGDALSLLAYAIGAITAIAAVFGATMAIAWLAARHAGARRHGPVVAALLIGYVGWRDTLDRGEALLATPLPPWEPATLLELGRWAAGLLLVMAGLWVAFEVLADRRTGPRRRAAKAGAIDEPVLAERTPAVAAASGPRQPTRGDGAGP
ncbi:MAG: hypothetical protein GEU93_13795 [Propionibacteriales bacterium]|nr:hypothetical protein [Propionibacteriales bacterium]